MGNYTEKAEAVQSAHGWDYNDTCSLKILMSVSQAVLKEHMSFHPASRVRRLHSTHFQQNHPVPAISETTSSQGPILWGLKLCYTKQTAHMYLMVCLEKKENVFGAVLQAQHRSCSHENKIKNTTRRCGLVKPTRANCCAVFHTQGGAETGLGIARTLKAP